MHAGHKQPFEDDPVELGLGPPGQEPETKNILSRTGEHNGLLNKILISVAPLFWAAPEAQGSGADSDPIGSASAPAPDIKGRLRLRTQICHFELT